MLFSKTALILALVPFVGFSATLISHSRTASADLIFVGGDSFTDSESTLLDGFAFLEAGVNPTPAVGAASEMDSVISSDRFEVTSAQSTVFNDNLFVAATAGTSLRVEFQINQPETWLFDLSFDGTYIGVTEFGGATAQLVFTNLTLPNTLLFWVLNHEESPQTLSEKLLLTPGQYRLDFTGLVAGDPRSGVGFEATSNASLLVAQTPIPEPSTYLGVSAALGAFLFARRHLAKR